MNSEQIKHIQKRIGTTPDGFWGPKSIQAVQKHLRSLMPKVLPWPKDNSKDLTDFYGSPGEGNLVNLSVQGLGVEYDGSPVKSIRCNRAVKESLERILIVLSHTFPEILKKYDGCFNNRNKRGGSTKSLHAYGAAIDFNASQNGNHTSWPVKATMPLEVMEIFAQEGWLAAGAFWGRDAMHFQATR